MLSETEHISLRQSKYNTIMLKKPYHNRTIPVLREDPPIPKKRKIETEKKTPPTDTSV